MSRGEGLWLAFGGGRIADRVDQHIQTDDTFTTAVSTEVRPRKAEIVLVSLSGDTIDFVGVAQAGKRVTTDAIQVRVSNLVPVGEIPLSDLEVHLPKRHRHAVRLPHDGPWRLSPGAWRALLDAIGASRPKAVSTLREMRKRAVTADTWRPYREAGLEAFERDAVASALETWAGAKFRKSVLRALRPAEEKENSDIAPFLARLSHATLREDPQIEHDHGVFPGFKAIRRYQVGAVEFENSNGERLTIVNCNRQPLERALGVDLIYYNHHFDSFALVQYKRMRKEDSGKVVYRSSSDGNFLPEMARMRAAHRRLGTLPKGANLNVRDLRLSRRPFFFKFCEAKTRGPLDTSMIGGMYVPYDVLSCMVREVKKEGRRGLSITWEQGPRRFSNGEFTRLLRDGWIGSRGTHSKFLSKLMRATLRSGRLLVYAATSKAKDARDYHRDDLGRFADSDDPLGST